MQLLDDAVWITFSSQTHGLGRIFAKIWCAGPDWYLELSTMVQFCTSFLHPLSLVERLHIDTSRSSQQDLDDFENADQEWLDLLCSCTAVKDIYLCKTFAQHIAFVLHNLIEGRLTEVLPTLQNMFVVMPSGLIQEGIMQFIAA